MTLDFAQHFLTISAPAMPPQVWYVAGIALLVLAAAATVDAFTSAVPDILIFIGLVLVCGAQGYFGSWDVAALQLRYALAAGIIIWAINGAWYKYFKRDALGMGDAKWTMLAVACFGIVPSLFAWGVGAILATFYIGILRLTPYRIERVTFAPFLLAGLVFGLCWRFMKLDL